MKLDSIRFRSYTRRCQERSNFAKRQLDEARMLLHVGTLGLALLTPSRRLSPVASQLSQFFNLWVTAASAVLFHSASGDRLSSVSYRLSELGARSYEQCLSSFVSRRLWLGSWNPIMLTYLLARSEALGARVLGS